MSNPPTLQATPNAISLLVSESGAMRYVNQDGLTVDLFGRVVAHASRLAPQATKKAPPTSATSGLSGSISSASAALQLSLVSKLKQRLTTAGLTLFKLTWKEKTTPAGRSVSLLRASALRTFGNDSTSWATPRAQDGERGGSMSEAMKWAAKERRPSGAQRGTSLTEQSKLIAGWPTTSTRDHKGGYRGGAYERRQDQHGHARRDGAANFWADCDWLSCQDGKYRPVESGTFPLAYGSTARVGRLRAYGNAIVPQAAQALIEAYLET